MGGQSCCSSHLTEARILEELFSNPQNLKHDDKSSSCQTVAFFTLGERPLAQALECLEMHFGKFQRVLQKQGDAEEQQRSKHFVDFEDGAIAVSISLDASHERILNLALEFPTGTPPLHPNEGILKFREWSGQYHLLVIEDDSILAAHNTDLPLAVGSAFKLFVLSALEQQVGRGDRAWADVFKLKRDWKSYPSGILQDWVDGSPLTLDTLASLMISISDNTAADHLLHLVSRESVEDLTERNRPFLTTLQLFTLKAPPNRKFLEQYRKLKTENERRKFLADTVDEIPKVDLAEFGDWTDPVAIDVEWIFTAMELRDVMATVKCLPLMSINPAIADAKDWAKVAYKGGSEPGVLNMTLWLEAHSGKAFYVIVTANDRNEPLNELAFILAVVRMVEMLKSL